LVFYNIIADVVGATSTTSEKQLKTARFQGA